MQLRFAIDVSLLKLILDPYFILKEGANQKVPDNLMELAMKNSWFRKSRARHSNQSRASKNFKPRDRPGLGHVEIEKAIAQIDNTPLNDDEDLDEGGFGGGKKRSTKSLLTSYVAASSLGTSRLSNIKTAFASGYGRFAKASTSGASTMDVGHHSNPVDSEMPKAMSTFQAPEAPKVKKSRWSN
eukprot:gene3421-3913_t